MRSEQIFSEIGKDITEAAENLGVEKPILKRQRKAPKRYEYSSNNNTHIFSTPEEYYRKTYFEMIDTTITSLQTRFESETMSLLTTFEIFITANEYVKVSDVTAFFNAKSENNVNNYEEDDELDERRLKAERDLFLVTMHNDDAYKVHLKNLIEKRISADSKPYKQKTSADQRYMHRVNVNDVKKLTLKDIVSYLKYKAELRPIFSQMTKLVKLLLTIPGSSCTNERSFSLLRRLKSYLRSNMLQDRLNSLTILNIYGDMCDDLDINDLMNKFIEKHNIRTNTFAVIRV